MNILEIIKKAPDDHVYWCTLIGECRVRIATRRTDYPIIAIADSCDKCGDKYEITESGHYFLNFPDAECVLFPSRDNRDWAAFERELSGVIECKEPFFIPADNAFNGSVEMVSIPDRPMMAAVIMSGMLAGGFKDSAGVLANKAVHYADIILKHTEEERDDKGTDSK